MSYTMLAHNVVGPSSRFSKGFAVVVTHVKKITNYVLFSLEHHQYTWHHTSRKSDLTDKGGGGMLSIPNPKDPGSRGDKYRTSECRRIGGRQQGGKIMLITKGGSETIKMA